MKVNEDTDKLKERLSVNLTGYKAIINNNNNNCPVITLLNDNQEGRVTVVSTGNQQMIREVQRLVENLRMYVM